MICETFSQERQEKLESLSVSAAPPWLEHISTGRCAGRDADGIGISRQCGLRCGGTVMLAHCVSPVRGHVPLCVPNPPRSGGQCLLQFHQMPTTSRNHQPPTRLEALHTRRPFVPASPRISHIATQSAPNLSLFLCLSRLSASPEDSASGSRWDVAERPLVLVRAM